MKIGGGTVRIFGKKQRVLTSVDVGDIHATVGANESVVCFGNEHAAFAANDALALGKGNFGDASVKIVPLGPGDGSFGWLDGG